MLIKNIVNTFNVKWCRTINSTLLSILYTAYSFHNKFNISLLVITGDQLSLALRLQTSIFAYHLFNLHSLDALTSKEIHFQVAITTWIVHCIRFECALYEINLSNLTLPLRCAVSNASVTISRHFHDNF